MSIKFEVGPLAEELFLRLYLQSCGKENEVFQKYFPKVRFLFVKATRLIVNRFVKVGRYHDKTTGTRTRLRVRKRGLAKVCRPSGTPRT